MAEATAQKAASADFPTASTVPFPFESPYAVQSDLMSAILDALRQCHDEDKKRRADDGSNDDEADDKTMGIARGGARYPKDARKAEKKRRAPIIMVESPTGTGKSLSLACASMAWLKHREDADLDEMLPPPSNEGGDSSDLVAVSSDDVGAKAVTPSPTASCLGINQPKKKKTYDWIEAWQPTDQQTSTDNDQPTRTTTPKSSSLPLPWESGGARPSSTRTAEERARNFAMQNRSALDAELNGIRARLDKLLSVASFANGNSPSDGGKQSSREQERTLRENLVRSGAASAMARQRKHNRQLARGGNAGRVGNKRRKSGGGDDEFLLEAYHSDDEGKRGGDVSSESDDDDVTTLNDLANKRHEKSGKAHPLSPKALLEGSNLDGSGYRNDPERNASANGRSWDKCASSDPAVGGVAAGSGMRKIIYAARTHSQLSQFIGELRRTHWGKDVKVVALGSRSLLCGNDDVLYSSRSGRRNGRRSEAEITEMCLDMQKNKRDVGAKRTSEGHAKSKKAKGCPYLASSEAVSTLAMHSLVRPSDIEDVANLGKASHSCSYYASREALAAAEVVALPYNTLLSPQARQSVGLSIRNALIVIDEAHNIPETLRQISSCMLSLTAAEAALSQLTAYTRRYSDRLAGRNVFYLGQIRRILTAMIKYLKRLPVVAATDAASKGNNEDDGDTQRKEMMAAVDLMFTLKLDNINLFAILRYLEKSRLSQKLLGFINHSMAQQAEGTDDKSRDSKSEFVSKHVSSMSVVETFLDRLCGISREGKIIVEWPSPQDVSTGAQKSPAFRFVQIQSASQLDIRDDAHAIVLAGGTLRPFTHVAAELFGNDVDVMKAAASSEVELANRYDSLPIKSSKESPQTQHSALLSLVQITPSLTTFTCGHVIPPSNVLTACLAFGPTSSKLDFRYSSRSSHDIIDELGRTILNLCNVVPKGFVVFLPSYKYESQVFQRWRYTGLLSQIEKKKSVHREPKTSRDVEAALEKYSDEASNTKAGALLFSVMGGKMSEGINFANDMARCVLVAGLPYADVTDPVLKEKMQSLDRDNGIGITGQAYYQNLCMRTVNQSVGRAIRHANDYAAIVLADFRYATDTRIWRGLPQWLRRGCDAPSLEDAVFGKVIKEVRSFFSHK